MFPRKEIPGYYLTPFGDRRLPKVIKYKMAGIKEITKMIHKYICSTVVHAETLGIIAVWPNSPAEEKNGKNEENPCH